MNIQEAVEYYRNLLQTLKIDPDSRVQAKKAEKIAVIIDYKNAGMPGTVRLYIPAGSFDFKNGKCAALERKWIRYSRDQQVDMDGVTGICIDGF